MSDENKASRPLHLQTIDSLFAELIGGASVAVGEGSEEFRFDNPNSRSILNWYRLNRAKWSGNVMGPDVEAIVSAIQTPLPDLPVPAIVAAKPGRRLRLAKIVAHRFAGVHAYGTENAPPPDFVFEFREPITLFDGWNGAGKTSLLNTIIWCLTGQLIRPQRQPESGQEEFFGLFVHSRDGVDEPATHALTPVTPLPNPNLYVPPAGKPVPVDSWVELSFVDQDGNPLPPVRRTQMRTPRGKVSETMSGFDTLGVDPVSLRIGTIMPALLHFLRIGEASDLGLAAAKLTGLADVSNLARHANKVRERLEGQNRKEREQEITEADGRFLEARGDLQKQIDGYAAMAPSDPLPTPSTAKELEQNLETLEKHFGTLKERALAEAQTILGPAFDPAAKSARDDLEASIGPAQGQLASLGQLPTAQRSRALSSITDQEWQSVEALVTEIREEAAALAELAETPALARRKQLYARVSGWLAEAGDHDPNSCSICSRSLDGVLDPITARPVLEHLAEVKEADQRLLSLTRQSWVAGWLGKLATSCPAGLRPELDQDLPEHPRELIRLALVDDLFETPAFQKTLMPLKAGIELLCDQTLHALPAFSEPVITPLPEIFGDGGTPLATNLMRLARARAFAQWRTAHGRIVTDTTRSMLQGTPGGSATITDVTPIGRKLEALASIVKGVSPLNDALDLCKRMSTQLAKRREKERRLDLYGQAVNALRSLIELGSLAEKQVDGLRKQLHGRAVYWRDRCYHNSFPMAGHALRDTSMDIKGVLDIRVGFEKANAPAQHISNASALRATLMGFFLAFWEYVLVERGGVSLLVLDDPQELLDHDNKEKLARLLPDLAKHGGQLVVATYDRYFARASVAAAREHASIEHRSVHPVNPVRAKLETAVAVEDLDRKREAYRRDCDNALLAQDFANEVRCFTESRLADLFDDPTYPAFAASSKAPSLVDHLGHLRSLIGGPPNALFKSKAVTELANCKALVQGADCLRVLNTSHHNKSSLSAGDVYAVVAELDQVRKLVEKAHLEFRHWRWREPLQPIEPPTNVVPFKSVSAPTFKSLIYPDLAAFTGEAVQNETQDDAFDALDQSWFADKALFLVRTNNLGFSIPDGCIAIAESSSYDGRDHNLVIARQKGHLLARRLLRSPNSDQLSLAAEAPDPRESKPTLRFGLEDVALHRIVGMLTEQPTPPPGKGEALQLSTAESLSQIKVAYRVREESAVPLALPGQLVLGGNLVEKSQLGTIEGALVALTLDRGGSIFKRVGKAVEGTAGRLWQFESIGGLGSSIIVSLVEPEDDNEKYRDDPPRFVRARKIIGVLYTA